MSGTMSEHVQRALRLVLPLVLVVLASCGSSSTTATTDSEDATHPLVVSDAPVPAIASEDYDTSGAYPRITDGDNPMATVNATITQVVVDDQHRTLPGGPLVSTTGSKGLYRVEIDRSLLSASSVVVSALLPTRFQNPDGLHPDDYWIAINIDVATGRRFGLVDILADPVEGLVAVADLVRTRILDTYPSCRQLILSEATLQAGFEPSVANYSAFSLTVKGLTVGFYPGQVGNNACGRMLVTVPWNLVRPLLSDAGNRLADGLRPAR